MKVYVGYETVKDPEGRFTDFLEEIFATEHQAQRWVAKTPDRGYTVKDVIEPESPSWYISRRDVVCASQSLSKGYTDAIEVGDRQPARPKPDTPGQ